MTFPSSTNASGIWTLKDARRYKAAGEWPAPPGAPTGLAVDSTGDGTIDLSWTAPATGNVTDYVVEYTPSGGSAATANVGSATTSYQITGLTNGTEYSVRVAASNAGLVGAYSTAVTGTPSAGVTVDYLVVAGGGSGGFDWGAGGGAGGYRSISAQSLASGVAHIVTVGAGAAAQTNASTRNSGSNSSLDTIVATGGGSGGNFGGTFSNANGKGNSGGSGGGTARASSNGTTHAGGVGNTPSTSPSQGNDGGGSSYEQSGGGGGAGSAGQAGASGNAGDGGSGAASSITGTSVTRAGGGGGGGYNSSVAGTGGIGGGGSGTSSLSQSGSAGTANTGGGGGGGAAGSGNGGSGGSGVVIIRAPQAAASTTGSPTVTTDGSDTIYTFTGSGSITF